jgi:hypothetical protein
LKTNSHMMIRHHQYFFPGKSNLSSGIVVLWKSLG